MTVPVDLPQVSSPLPWQGVEWQALAQQLQSNTMPHALLLAGAQYTGKSHLALSLARLLLCDEPQNGHNCGQCHACELSARWVHGDFRWVKPEPIKKKKSRVIKIDQVRDVLQFARGTASFGSRKVVVFTPADTMNVSAFNALLKLLEEPPDDTYLILVCHRLSSVPATIRSRCQMLRCPLPDEASSLAWLEHLTGQPAQARSLLSLAEGRPLLAEQLYLKDTAQQTQTRRAGLQALLSGNARAVDSRSLWLELETEELLEQITDELNVYLRALPVAQLQTAKSRAVFGLVDELARLRAAVDAGSNPNKALMLDAIVGKIQRVLGEGL